MRGKMLWFNEEKGHGYIATEEGERLYVDRAGFTPGHVPVGRCADLDVEFEIAGDGDERSAVNVIVPEVIAPRRARRRAGSRGHSG
jgi:cold shock CspA family protein